MPQFTMRGLSLLAMPKLRPSERKTAAAEMVIAIKVSIGIILEKIPTRPFIPPKETAVSAAQKNALKTGLIHLRPVSCSAREPAPAIITI